MKFYRNWFKQEVSDIWLWGIFFSYACIVALLVQLVLLPYVFPGWNAGDGLLVGGDWVMFHQIALEMAEKIHSVGWSAWELRPQGQAPSGIAAAIYALTVPHPWTIIPINAALHATAGLVLWRIVRVFLPDRKRAITCVLPFLLYPSAVTWYAQLHKDGYFIAGLFLFIYAWVLIAQFPTWQRSWKLPITTLLLSFSGVFLIWVVRPYSVEMLQAIALLPAFGLTILFSRLTRRKAIAGIIFIWTTWLLMLIFSQRSAIGDVPPVSEIAWSKSFWLPHTIDEKLQAIATLRQSFFTIYPNAGSKLDPQVSFHQALDMIRYLPRALQIAFFAPFPPQWFGQGTLEANTLMRRISAIEMSGVYLALLFLPIAIWQWWRRWEFWIVFWFCSSLMIVNALALPNMGTLYRMRYGSLMAIIALSLAGFFAIRQRKLAPKSLLNLKS